MSMPNYPLIDPPLTRDGSVNEIISSIAAEELSLSHILNAEGEKLQFVLGTLPGLSGGADVEDVLKVNESVRKTLDEITQQQLLLGAKLNGALDAPVYARFNKHLRSIIIYLVHFFIAKHNRKA